MRNKAILIATAAVLLTTIAGSALAGELAKSGFIERTVSVKNTGASGSETVKIYWEGDRIRVEKYTIHGLVVDIKDGRTLYLYNPAGKKAAKTVVPEKYARTVQDMIEGMTGPMKGGKKVGSSTVAGIKCDVYSVTGKVKGHSAKVYVSTDPRLPVPLKLVESMGNLSRTIETRLVKLNYNVPDSMFTIPKGVKVEESKFPTPQAPPQAPKK